MNVESMQGDQWPNTPEGPVLACTRQHSSIGEPLTPDCEPEAATAGMLADASWPDKASLSMTLTDDYRCGHCNDTVINSNDIKIGTPDSSYSFPNKNLKALDRTRPAFTKFHGIVGSSMQNAASNSIPDIRQSELNRLKSLQRFASQQARSVEELTRRHRKLDHLQRCLKRYEIERFEAGQAVRRIEDRLKELRDRTSDLLSSAINSSGHNDVEIPVHENWNQPWNSRVMNNNGIASDQLKMPTPNKATGDLPSSTRNSKILRKPSKNRPKCRPLQTTANRMYVEAEQMFAMNPLPDRHTEENSFDMVTSIQPQSNNRSESTGTETPCGSRDEKRNSEETLSTHVTGCACSQQQVSLAQKRIAELEARHNTLVEHLNLQRSRLAAADATVVSLARTLLQFTMKTEAEKAVVQEQSIKGSTNKSNGLNGLIDCKTIYYPHSAPFDNPIKPMPDPLGRMPHMQVPPHQNSEFEANLTAPVTSCTSLMNPTAWDQCSMIAMMSWPEDHRLQHNTRCTNGTMKNANEYIHLSTTESVLPLNEPEDGTTHCESNYSPSVCNRLPNYFTDFNQPKDGTGYLSSYQSYFVQSPPPPPPLPPKPVRHDRCQIAQPVEEVSTMEDEEVSHFMSPRKDDRIAVSISIGDVQRSSLDACITQRPPPPPYYVNLFGSDKREAVSTTTATTAASDTAAITTQFVRVLSREPTSAVKRLSSAESNTRRQVSLTSTRTPETVIERSEQSRHDLSTPNCLADSNLGLATKSALQKNAPPFPITNLRDYLDAMGHDLKRLTRDKPDLDEKTWPRMTTPATSCFNSRVVRWFRSSLPNGNSRVKPRHHSLDDKDSVALTSVWQWTDELRILLTENQCEGFLWIQNRPQSSGRPKSRPWRTIRITSRGWADGSMQSGRDSPNPATNQRCTRKWRSTRWIRLWFVCDVRSQSITYHEQGRGDRMKGSFRFSEVRSVEPGLVSTSEIVLGEELQPHHQSDPEGACETARTPKQTRSSNLFQKYKARTVDSTQESQSSFGGLRQPDELNQLAFRIETWMQIYTLKAANTALRNLWMDVFHFAIQSARR